MPTTKKTLTEIARDYAEGSELSAALEANAPVAPTQDQSRQPWARRWIDLSQWARQRELRTMERELTGTLEELRLASENAEQEAAEALQRSVQASAFFHYVVECDDPQGTSEITFRLAEAKAVQDAALQALKAAAEARNSFAEAKSVVTVAQLRSQTVRRHFTELRQVRTRAFATSFLLTLVLTVAAAILMHYRMRGP